MSDRPDEAFDERSGAGSRIMRLNTGPVQNPASLLHGNEHFYRQLFNSIDQGFCVVETVRDGEGRLVDLTYCEANAAYEKQTGFSPPPGLRMKEIAPDIEDEWMVFYDHVSKTGSPATKESFNRDLKRWFKTNACRMGPEGSPFIGIVVEDVTERHLAEQALRASEERQVFLLTLSDALRLLTESRDIERAATRLLGEHLQADRCFLSLVYDDGSGMYVREEYLRAGASSVLGDYTFAEFGNFVGPELHADRILAVEDVSALTSLAANERASYAAVEIGAYLLIPLVRNGRLAAFLTINHRTPRLWSAADKAVSRQTADRLWTARERGRVEAALRASEERYHALFAASPVPFMVLDANPADFTILAANDAYLAATLTTRETLIGRRLFDVFTDDPKRSGQLGSEVLDISLARVLRTQTTDAMERVRYDIVRPDGRFEPHWWLAINAPLFDSEGNITAIIHQVDRQTELHYAENALRASEARFRALVTAGGNSIYRMSADWGLMYQLDSDTLATTSAPIRDWVDKYIPQDDLVPVRAAIDEAIRTKSPFELEHRVLLADGSVSWVLSRAVPLLGPDGSIFEWFGAGVDVSERRRADERVAESERFSRALVEGVPLLVWRAADRGSWTWASPQWTAFTGQPESESHGSGWLAPVHPDDRDRVQAIWATAIGRGEFEAEYRICHATEQRYRWFQTRATPVRDDTGEIAEWLGTSTDVDDIRNLQERQTMLVVELQHRTRNLMGVVRSMADRTGDASTSFDDFRVRFRDRLEALARVQALLSRLGETDRIAFDELIRAELKAMNGATERVTLDGPSGIRLRSGMVQTLAMALHELATNALKYGALSQPQAHLTIVWRMTPPDARGRPWLHIDWRESGVDMSRAEAAMQGTGQGRELIEEALPYQLSAETRFELGRDGVHCTLAIPVSASNLAEEAAHV